MERERSLRNGMAEATAKVHPALQQQSNAVGNVKLSIELIADRSHNVAAAAQEVVSTVVAQTALAAELAAPGWKQEEN